MFLSQFSSSTRTLCSSSRFNSPTRTLSSFHDSTHPLALSSLPVTLQLTHSHSLHFLSHFNAPTRTLSTQLTDSLNFTVQLAYSHSLFLVSQFNSPTRTLFTSFLSSTHPLSLFYSSAHSLPFTVQISLSLS